MTAEARCDPYFVVGGLIAKVENWEAFQMSGQRL